MRYAEAGSWLRGSFVLAMVVGGLCLGILPPIASANAPPGKSASFAELTEEAEEERAVGKHRNSAFLFGAAYGALPEAERGGLKGEITVSNAVDDYRLAQERDPESLVLLKEEAALLESFAEHPMRQGTMPAGLAEELERVNERLEERRAEERERSTVAAKQKQLARAEERAKAEESAKAEEGADGLDLVELRPGLQSRRKADAAILGAGLVSVGGGTVLLANGAWNMRNAERRGEELLDVIDANDGGTVNMRASLRNNIEGWQDGWRRISTGLLIGGAVLTAAGIGLTTWGIVRMLRGKGHSGQASVVRPMIWGRGVGVSAEGRF